MLLSFIPDADSSISNMAVMEVEFPSGYTADIDGLKSLKSLETIKWVETKNSDTVATIYFESLSEEEVCATLVAYRTYKVAQHKPVPITVFDYYDTGM